MTRQKTLFPEPEPEPEQHGPVSEPLDPNVMYATLEDDEELPVGIAAYVQQLYENWRPRIGEALARRRVQRIVNDYHQIEDGEQ